MKRHFLIIGQGLAGSILTKTLIENEQAVTVVDNVSPQSASRIAAGIINPLTGQRMVIAPDVSYCLPAAIERYTSLAEEFNQSFYSSRQMLRLFNNSSDKDRFRSRKDDASYGEYLGEAFDAGKSGEPINDSQGGFKQKHTGYLNISLLLDCLKEHFKKYATYIDGQFDYDELEIANNAFHWKDNRFDHVVFCEGANAVNNPWFRWLPFQLSRGELLSINSEQRLPTSIINKGHWLLPLDEYRAKIGASYSWSWTDETPSVEAKQDLIRSAEEMVPAATPLAITDHQCGIRPTTKDKQPFIGRHPQFRELYCFNGFGSRGGMLIPYYANCLVDNLLKEKSLPTSVDVNRFEETKTLVVRARRYLSENSGPGDIVIDATVGNGHDTELLARCVGESGHVYGFDIQQQALSNTHRRLLSAGLSDRVTLIRDDHANMLRHLNGEKQKGISIIVFNLGFLPGSDKSYTTSAQTTLQALKVASQLIQYKGSIVVMTYSGHECGKKETELVHQWKDKLDRKVFKCRMIDAKQKRDAPSLLIITKTKE